MGIRVVKAYVREDHERQKFQKANDEFTHAGLRAVLTIILQQPIMMMGITTVTALVLYFGGHMVLSGNLEVGTLSSIVTYIFNANRAVLRHDAAGRKNLRQGHGAPEQRHHPGKT